MHLQTLILCITFLRYRLDWAVRQRRQTRRGEVTCVGVIVVYTDSRMVVLKTDS